MNKDLLSAYYVPSTVLVARIIAVNNRDNKPCSHRVYILMEGVWQQTTKYGMYIVIILTEKYIAGKEDRRCHERICNFRRVIENLQCVQGQTLLKGNIWAKILRRWRKGATWISGFKGVPRERIQRWAYTWGFWGKAQSQCI